MMQRTIIDPKIRNLIDLSQAGAAAVQAKYGGEMRTEMVRIEPEYLIEDELEYELLLRGLLMPSADDRGRTRALRTRLIAEQRGARVPNISPVEYATDVETLKAKIAEVAQVLQAEEVEGHTYKGVLTRLAHLEQRVHRLSAEVEPKRAEKEDLSNQLIRSLVDYTNAKGARPKERPRVDNLPELNGQFVGRNDPPRDPTLIDLDILSYQNAEAEVPPMAAPMTDREMQEERRTFNDILGMMGARPEAQSTSWSNRDSLGTAISGGSRNVQFSLNTARNVNPRNFDRRDTPYPGRGRPDDLQSVAPSEAHQTNVGEPEDYTGRNGGHSTSDVHGRLARGVLNDHVAMCRNGFDNAREAINGNPSIGTRTYNVESAFAYDTRRQNENAIRFGRDRQNSLGQFGRNPNDAIRTDQFGQPERAHGNVFGILSPNRNTVAANNDTNWGRNASEFGHFARTKAVPVHTWKVTFSGENRKMSDTDVGANEFIYRVNVNKRMQGLSDADILSQVGFLLTHSASTWYLACQHMFTSWQSFVEAMRRTFLSAYHMIDAMDEISRRTQGKTESARAFLYHMVMLFRALPCGVEEHIQTHIIVRNLLPEIQANVGPWGPTTIAELERILGSMQPRSLQQTVVENKPPVRRAFVRKVNAVEDVGEDKGESVFEITEEELCAIRRERETRKNNGVVVPKGTTSAIVKKTDRARPENALRLEDMKCFNCQEMGHSFRKCPKDRVGKFCFRCGKPDVTTNDCVDCPKNQVSCLDSEDESQTDQNQIE